MNRERTLRDACDLVVRIMELRAPQAEALRAFRDALIRLPAPLSQCSDQQRREYLTLREGWSHPYHPNFTMALATGVGKTRLTGAIIALLWLAQEAKTFLILAPRRAVLRRFESAFDLRYREYIFVDQNLVPEPSIVRADEIDSPRSFEFEGDLLSNGPKIFLLSPQLIASSDRFTKRQEFAEKSPQQALRERRDLVVIADEAHHIGKLNSKETTAWSDAVRQIQPAIQIGLTATPRRESGENLLFEYSLQRALREGLYTKSVHICVREFGESSLDAEDIDRSAITYSLDRLDRKEQAIKAAVSEGSFPPTKPICVFFARDIEHAHLVRDWILATQRIAPEEVLLTHSAMSKSEEEIEKLLSIESTSNPTRVVVNVMELTEGWDVTNVYVVTPLRAMATFQGALQAMGRGLRLPAGMRVGDPVLDELDVVSFGREALAKIVRESTQWAGPHGGHEVKVTTFDRADPVLVPVAVPVVREETVVFARCVFVEEDLNVVLHESALGRVREAVVTEVELAAAHQRLGYGRPRIDRERFIHATAYRVIKSLGRYLSDAQHLPAVMDLVRGWLDAERPDDQGVDFDPAEVGEQIARALEAGAKIKPARYELGSGTERYHFPSFVAKREVMIGPADPLPTIKVEDLDIFDGSNFVKGQPYRGWRKSLHSAYGFDSRPEALLSLMLDQSASVDWWVRNSPTRFHIDTPAGQYRPDFLVSLTEAGSNRLLILEAKGDHMWVDPNHVSRLKSAAAKQWATLQKEAGYMVDASVALQSEIEGAGSWEELSGRLE